MLVIHDVSRLFSRQQRRVPTGIDRVELASIVSFLDDRRDTLFLRIKGKQIWFVDLKSVKNLTDILSIRWQTKSKESAVAFRRLTDFLNCGQRDAVEEMGAGAVNSVPAVPDRKWRYRRPTREGWRRIANEKGDIKYINVSHHHLEKTSFLRDFKQKTGSSFEFFWHDGIPIRHPEFSVPGDDQKHLERLRTVCTLGDAIVVNSKTTKIELLGLASEHGLSCPRISVSPLRPSLPDPSSPVKAGRRYFLCIGTIEPRKNHLLLLMLWKRLADRLSDETPALILVGQRGWLASEALAMLDRSAALRGHVFQTSELSDQDLSNVLAGAEALLMPSFAEGFGLPVAESLALGVQTIASSIPAHMEVSGGEAVLVPPDDLPAWEKAVVNVLNARDEARF